MREVAVDRISVDVGDPGHEPYKRLGGHKARIKVFLDGVEQRGCTTADRAQGWVRRFVEQDGSLQIRLDRVVTEVVYGKVEIKVEDAA